MIACLDVHYTETVAHAAAVVFDDWTAAAALEEKVVRVEDIQPYVPGEFYRRELPCLLAILQALPPVEIVVIDGYVWLGSSKPGLGAHLHQALGGAVVVIGVAKTKYASADAACVVEILRGTSERPLYITAAGMSAEAAAEHVRSMRGDYRTPTLLRCVDHLCRHAAGG
ncbi:MAG: endonuclease V [Prosthecobacter sp.]